MIKHIVHHSRSFLKRGLFSLFLVTVVMVIGTAGLRRFENISWIEAFYYMSMVATAQGPTFTPKTGAGMVFVSFMAFLSVGTVVTSLGFIFGPFFNTLWHEGLQKFEGEIFRSSKNKSD